MIVLVLFQIIKCQLIVPKTQEEYQVELTAIGFVPYGRNITGILKFYADMCAPQLEQGIILTYYSKECSLQKQLDNAKSSLAIIFDEIDQGEIYNTTSQVIVLEIEKEQFKQLKLASGSNVSCLFKVPQTLQPQFQYITYELNQSIQVLKQLQQFILQGFGEIQPLFYITEYANIFLYCKLGQLFADDDTPIQLRIYDIILLDCDSYLEVNYGIIGDRTGKLNFTEVLQEYVVESCINKQYGSEKWLDYRISFIDYCFSQLPNSNEILECQRLLLEKNQINIDDCVNNSQHEEQNDILEEQKQLSEESELDGVYAVYSGYIQINNQLIHGHYPNNKEDWYNINTSTLFNALCESYSAQKPKQCPQSILQVEYQSRYSIVLWSVLIIISVTCIIMLMCYLRKLYLKELLERQNLQNQINQLLQNTNPQHKLNVQDE